MKQAIICSYSAGPFYVHFKKHFCPQCKERMNTKTVIKVVNSQSPEAKGYDFSIGDTFLIGDVKFKSKCFVCPVCRYEISFKDMKRIEKI